MRSSRPDVVVTIKGDILQADYWQSIEEVGAKRITWFYDELRRMNVDEAGLQMRGPIATYSAIDAAAMAERGWMRSICHWLLIPACPLARC